MKKLIIIYFIIFHLVCFAGSISFAADTECILCKLTSAERKQLVLNAYREELEDISQNLKIANKIDSLEKKLSEISMLKNNGYVLRSKHFIFGHPILKDDRYNHVNGTAGVSLLFREGFVSAYSEKLFCPIWVCQRWNNKNYDAKQGTPSLKRDWRDDPEIPSNFHRGTGYSGNKTKLDRGHMAKHSMNRAWGFDNSIYGCLMTNSVPQHLDINRKPGAWHRIEDAIEKVVNDSTVTIRMVWTISGAVFRDQDNPESEPLSKDLNNAAIITSGFRVPYATYKVIGWFDETGKFHARGFLFEQPYTILSNGKIKFSIPDQTSLLDNYIVPIDEIEKRVGVNFFPNLKDDIEDQIESTRYDNIWSDI